MKIHTGLLHSLAVVLVHQNAYPRDEEGLTAVHSILHRDAVWAAKILAVPRCLSDESATEKAPALIDLHVNALALYCTVHRVSAPRVYAAIAAAGSSTYSDNVLKFWTAQVEKVVYFPASDLVLSPDGVRTVAEIEEGSVIWSGKQWTKVKRKTASGVKPVYAYHTCVGVFVGSKQCKVFEHGQQVDLSQAKGLDQCPLPTDSEAKANALCTVTVDHTEFLNEAPVFDIIVSASEHSYWANGFLAGG